MKKLLLYGLAIWLILSACSPKNEAKEALWVEISSFFQVPEEFKGVYGNYRSPLLFYNGDSVKTPEDWKRRRKEIKEQWMKLMGEWPDLLLANKLEILSAEKKEKYTEYRVRLKWTPSETTEGYLLKPDTKGSKPAVITVYYEPETSAGHIESKQHCNYGVHLVDRGFVVLALGTKEATASKTYSLFYPSIDDASVEPLSMLAYAAANAYEALAKEEDVDASRIGIVGHSFGGKWAMFASCLYDKFACSVWSDPGIVFDETRADVNYWEPYYLGYHPRPWRKRGRITPENPAQGVYLDLVRDGYDLHELHALMAPRPFLVSGGSEDPVERWIPLNHTIQVNQLLGFENRVGMTNRKEHKGDEHSMKQLCDFLEYFLK